MSYQPRGLTFEQFNVGDTHICQGRTVTEADVVHFAGISGDYNPLHTNEEYGKDHSVWRTDCSRGAGPGNGHRSDQPDRTFRRNNPCVTAAND